MKSRKKGTAEEIIYQKVRSLEKQEKAAAEENEYQDSRHRSVMILSTAFLCLAIAAAGVIITMTVYRDRGGETGTSPAESTALPAVSYHVDSFSADTIYNSGTYSQITAADGAQIVTAPPAETAASSVTETECASDEPQPDVTEPQNDTPAARPASTAVSVTERGYNGNVLFG